MQMLAANHTPNERSSDCNSDCGNNWQLRVAQSLEAERQLAAYTQFPQTRPGQARPDQEHDIKWQTKSNYSKRHNRIATQAEAGEEEEERRRGRTEGNLQAAEAVVHGRASWALKSPRCDEAAN